MDNLFYDLTQSSEVIQSSAIIKELEDHVLKFITDYIPLSPEEVRIINEQNSFVSFKKNDVLVAEGDFVNACYFILKGCVRSYYLIDGEEKTTEFYTENQSIVAISYVEKRPSKYYLSCLEDCIFALGSAERDKALIEKIPKLEYLIMQMNQKLLVENQISFDNFKNLNPEMRYLKLLETRPDLVYRVPQYHLATYLGITPESLSRLRKRISNKREK